ncbi:hypothetical protein ASPZODRAFT_68468 [Penicilliopsis zonata CBS 506.65]|uniref:DNA repair and recombination protein RAD54B n=1 Tax=Penicilliopsis zonata CBS 506.65 TaxID=1073090 RepID=A0A1L9SEQ9_9EURO|nr:hypothetical protein ASPZODRAFT_68468 [Penicilliopsis zonata CBS 506.65]OJJ45577.1 hypothetical protein ASPZODRAFT_68468 [Penicilliopsis zonata CBS 506.65]
MVFKPFKPLSINKPPVSSLPSSLESPDDSQPPAKKPRIDDEAGHAVKGSSGRVPRKNLPVVELGTQAVETESASTSDDRYYNVLWRKYTTKKNKTWDGDGILAVRSGYAYLQDVSGKDMGRVMVSSRLEAGSALSIGGKEVEVDSEMAREEYLSGRRFLDIKKPVATPQRPTSKPIQFQRKESVVLKRTLSTNSNQSSSSTKTTVTKPAGSSLLTAYKKPILDTTPVPKVEAGQPVPRHDPAAPDALVMKRPDSVPRGKRIVDVVVDPLLAKHLRPHQREGVQFLYECVMGMRSFNGEGAILADDMGLGKTLQTITLIWTLLKQNPVYEDPPVVKKALIVCPVTLINNWRKEFRKWLGNERIGVFVFDDKKKRLTDFTRGKAYSIMIVGYEKLRTVQEGLTKGHGVDIIIADEGHRLKTLQNKSGQAIQSLNASKRVILSGTPIQNDLKEFFAAVDLVNPGVLGTLKAFIREFEGPIVKSRQPEATRKDIEKGEARSEELRNLTSQFILRRTADILAKYLPPKTEYVLFCRPTPTQANLYRNVLASPVFQGILGSSESALQLITILKKLCNSPSLLSGKAGDEVPKNDTISALLSSLPSQVLRHLNPSSSAKIRVLDQLLYNLHTATSEKIVLVSNYTSTLNLLANLLASLSLPFLRLDGSTPAQKRQALVDDFNRLPASACFAFLLSAKAGGTGLNLIGASRLVLFDVDWNPATDIQAMARIHRDGQKRHCRIYRVLLQGSLEEKIWQRQVTKLGLADSVMERRDSVAQFSRDELRDLFRLDEESRCQTHELLGCECGGKGGMAEDTRQSSRDSLEEVPNPDDDDDIESLPDLPTLIKASELNMEEQERQVRARRHPSSRSKKESDTEVNNIRESLSHYAHIDPALLSDPDSAEAIRREVDDEDVLLPFLKEEDCRIGFIFKKTSRIEDRAV